MKYTFSDEEEIGSDAPSTRRSNRHSGISTPAEAAGPTFTASGRQVRSRHGGAYGETMLSGQQDDQGLLAANTYDGQGESDEEGAITRGRTRGKSSRNGLGQNLRSRNRINNYNAVDAMDDESDATSSGGEWEGGDDDDDAEEQGALEDSDEDTAMSDNNSDIHGELDTDRHGSLIVSLRYQQKKGQHLDTTAQASKSETPANQPRSPQLSNGHHEEPAELIKEGPVRDQISSTIMGEPAKGPGLANGISDVAFQPKQTDYSHSSNDITAT